jgi:signal recognition particle subunit SEC65
MPVKPPQETDYKDLKPILFHPVNFDISKPHRILQVPHEIVDILILTVSQMVYALRMGHGTEENDSYLFYQNIHSGDCKNPEEWVKKNKTILFEDLKKMYATFTRDLTQNKPAPTPWAIKIRLSDTPEADVFELQSDTLKQIQETLKSL